MTYDSTISDVAALIADADIVGITTIAGLVRVRVESNTGACIALTMEPRVIERAYAVLVAEGLAAKD